MDFEQFERVKAAIGQADAGQCIELEALVRHIAARRQGEIFIVKKVHAIEKDKCCPRCGQNDVVKHGVDKAGRQRFFCRKGADGGCGKIFNALTATPFARMRMPEKWIDHARLMDGFLSLTSVVEADGTFFRSSYKGHRGWVQGSPPKNRPARYRGGKAVLPGLSGELVPVLTAVDRANGVVEVVLPDRSAIVAALDGRIANGSVLCSDGLRAYVKAAAMQRSEHYRIFPSRKDWLAKAVGGKSRKEGRLGLGRVSGHHERLKTFINRELHGV